MCAFKRIIMALFGLCVFSCYGTLLAKTAEKEPWKLTACDIFKSYNSETGNKGFPRLLRGNESSYFVWAQDQGDASGHAEFYLSFKYPILCGDKWNFDFNYNGKYDFYLNSRYSSPIISRLQNPGLTFGYTFDEIDKFNLNSITISSGYFHESNGQTISTLQEYNTALLSNPNVQDAVSRGWDYIPLDFKLEFESVPVSDVESKFTLYLKHRFFLAKQVFTQDREDIVFWEPGRIVQPKIGEYDGIRLLLDGEFDVKNNIVSSLKLSALFRTGYQAFNFSQRYEATFRININNLFHIPLYVFYSNGYGRELSTYHRKNAYHGIGIEFW